MAPALPSAAKQAPKQAVKATQTPPPAKASPAAQPSPVAPVKPAAKAPTSGAHAIEPGRRRRLAVGRDPIEGRLDLHGMSRDEAHAALVRFVETAHAEGRRNLLVITGKGILGDGVLRRRAPQWLAEAPMRRLIAGVGEAHRRHGGAGALYLLLKRRSS
jgi:DNA-nicking Smr family endonuclease